MRMRRVRFSVPALALAIVAALAAPLGVTSAAAVDSPVTALSIATAYDGVAVPNALDGSAGNGIVATNDQVGYTWSFTTARDLAGATITQTLPAGWSWNAAAVAALTSSVAAYQSSAVISPDGLTLTATLTTTAGASIVLGPLPATPSAYAAGSVYSSSVTISDAGGSASASGGSVEVRSGAPQLTAAVQAAVSSSIPQVVGSVPGQRSQVNLTFALPAYVGQPATALPAGSVFTITTSGIAAPDLIGVASGITAAQAGAVTTVTTTAPLSPGQTLSTNVVLWWPNSRLGSTSTFANYALAAVSAGGFTLSAGSALSSGNTVQAAAADPTGGWFFFSCTGGAWVTCPTTVMNWNTAPNNTVAADAYLRHRLLYNGARDTSNLSVADGTIELSSEWNPAHIRLALENPPVVTVSAGGVTTTPSPSSYTTEYRTPSGWVAASTPGVDPLTIRGVRFTFVTPWALGLLNPAVQVDLSFQGRVSAATASNLTGTWRSDLLSLRSFTRNFRLVPIADSATMTVNKSAVTAPDVLRYTTTVSTQLPPGGVASQTSSGTTVVQTFPSSVLQVVPVGLDPGWTMTQTVDANNQIVATYTRGPLTVTGTTPTALPPIVVDATLSPVAPASRQVVVTGNVVTQNAQSAFVTPITLSATTTVNQAQVIALTVKAVQRTVEVGVTPVRWTVDWQNFKPAGQGLTYVVGVLPFVGDSGGSAFTGSISFGSATLCASPTGTRLQYTTDPASTVQSRRADDPATTWIDVSPSALGGTGATAFRVVIDDFQSGASCSLAIDAAVTGNRGGDRYALSVFGNSALGGDLPRTVPAAISVIESSVSGRVMNDAAASGVSSASLAGFPGIPVELQTQAGATVATTTTDSQGAYSFSALVSGTYRVVVGTAALPVGFAATFAPAATIAVAAGTAVTGVDFGYIVYRPALTATQSHVLPATIAAGQAVDITYVISNTGNAPLTNVVVAGISLGVPVATWPGAAGQLNPGASVTLAVRHVLTQAEVDAGVLTSTVTVTGRDPVSQNANAQSTESIPIVGLSQLRLIKSGSFTGVTVAGAPVSWSFTVTNSGALTLSNVTIEDDLASMGPLTYTWPSGNPVGVLAPGQSATATATSPLSAAEAADRTARNTARASGTEPGGASVSTPTVTALVSLGAAALEGRVVDDAAASGTPSPAFPGFAGVPVVLLDGGGATVLSTTTGPDGDYRFGGLPAGTYTVQVDESALPTGSAPTFAPTQPIVLTTGESLTGVDFGYIVYRPAMTITQSPALPAPITAGATVEVTITVTNTGNGRLTGVVIDGVSLGTATPVWPGAPGELAPGDAVTAVVAHVLTQEEIDAGSITSSASTRGTDPVGQLASASSSTAIPLAGTPSLTVTKSGSFSGVAAPGASVSWSFTVVNSGHVTLSNVAITDALPGLSPLNYTWPAAAGVLRPGETVTATASSALTAAQATAQEASNEARASATTPGGSSVESAPATAVVDLPSGVLSGRIVDDIDGSGSLTPGDGGFDAVPVSLYTTAGALVAATATDGDGSYAFEGLPSGDYEVRVDDTVLPAGAWPTFAPAGLAVVVDGSTTGGVDFGFIVYAPALTMTQTHTLPSTLAAGQLLEIRYSLRNIGNAPLTSVAFSDLTVSGVPAESWPGAPGELLPGASATLTVTHTLTQDELDAGAIDSAASAAGADPLGRPASSSSREAIALPADAALTVQLSGAFSGLAREGAPVTWAYTLTNTGAVTLTNVTIGDPRPGLSPLSYTWPAGQPAGGLAPGETATATATSTLSASQVAAHVVTATVDAAGTAPAGATVTAAEATANVALPAASVSGRVINDELAVGASSPAQAGFAAVPVALLDGDGAVLLETTTGADGSYLFGGLPAGRYQVLVDDSVLPAGTAPTFTATGAIDLVDGEQRGGIDYGFIVYRPALVVSQSHVLPTPIAAGGIVEVAYVITNTGNAPLASVTLTGVSVSGTSVASWPGPAGEVPRGGAATITVSHVLTQAEVDAGALASTAEATGLDPLGRIASGSTSASVGLAADAGLSVSVSGSFSGLSLVGAPVDWSFTVTNAGSVTLSNITIDDATPGLSALNYSWPAGNPVGRLAPGESATATATSPLSGAQVAAHVATTTAQASGTRPSGGTVTSTAVTAAVDLPFGSVSGRVVDDATASGVSSASLVGFAGVPVELLDDDGATLLTTSTGPDGSYTFGGLPPATYSVSVDPSGLPRGWSATFSPADTLALDPDEQRTGVDFGFIIYRPALTLDTTWDLPVPVQAGEVVTLTSVLTNTGNGALTDVAVTGTSGPSVIAWPATAGTLAPGQSATVTQQHTLTQSEVDAGVLPSAVSASGVDPLGQLASVTDANDVPLAAARGMTMTGTATFTGFTLVGAPVTWAYSVTNTGAVTLSAVTLSSDLAGLSAFDYVWPGTPGVLAPGQSVTATATSALTAEQIAARSVSAIATATGRTPSDVVVTTSATSVTTPIPRPEEVSLTIQSEGRVFDEPPGLPVAAGTPIEWTYVVENLGTRPVRDIQVTDTTGGGSTVVGGLAPGEVLMPGESLELRLTTTALAGPREQTATVSAVADSESAEPGMGIAMARLLAADVLVLEASATTYYTGTASGSADPAPLANTGWDATPGALAAAILVLLGAWFVGGSRRRRARTGER